MALVGIDPFGASFVHVNDFGMIETKQTENRGMQVVHVNLVFDRMQAELVRFADDLSAFYAATGHPHGEAGRVVIPDITSGGGFANFGAIAYAAGGNEQNVGPGLEVIKSLNSLKFWSRGGEVVTQFESGDVYAAVVHAGWCLRARKAGSPVDTVQPVITGTSHVGVGKYGWLVIPKHSKVPEAASWFINEYQEPEFQMLYAVKSGVVPTNRKSISQLASDPIFAEMLELDPAKIGNQLKIDYQKADTSDWIDQWNRSVSQ